ncbi:cuticle protein AMP5 [Homarus americanus]|uniref:cuticle protein AMP5 n=1 Tax=Homarus americanus TaxID=6706 RepID=UPI001C451370|nr:cuticle protein AMP5 [Homarus americanus]
MKLIILASLAVIALAAPQAPKIIETITDNREDDGAGNYFYEFETENGIRQSVRGTPGAAGAVIKTGSFSFPLDDGTLAEFIFEADENGYRVDSPLIPVAPPNPSHVEELLQIVAQLKAQGAQWNDQGERID